MVVQQARIPKRVLLSYSTSYFIREGLSLSCHLDSACTSESRDQFTPFVFVLPCLNELLSAVSVAEYDLRRCCGMPIQVAC